MAKPPNNHERSRSTCTRTAGSFSRSGRSPSRWPPNQASTQHHSTAPSSVTRQNKPNGIRSARRSYQEHRPTSSANGPIPAALPPSSPMRTLVVDDSPDMRKLIQSNLTTKGQTEVLTAESAREAFRHLAIEDDDSGDAPIDLILMDIMMSDMDGIRACQRIKAVERLREIPIIMVTGRTDSEDLRAAFAAGAMDYITKPLNSVELLARVSSALALKRAIDIRKARER